jgi:hypothetical protein
MQLWDQLQQVARRHGLSEQAAGYYQSICRESYNHGWSVESMALLGILDVEPEDGSFFKRFGSDEEVVSAMREIWRYEEPKGAP